MILNVKVFLNTRQKLYSASMFDMFGEFNNLDKWYYKEVVSETKDLKNNKASKGNKVPKTNV